MSVELNAISDDMEQDEEDSEYEFEVIIVNPNVDYESDDSEIEDLSQNCTQVELQIPTSEETFYQEKHQEVSVELPSDILIDEVSCDSIITPIDDENSMNSCDSLRKVRKKLNLQEYKMRRANEIPQEKPLFDVPRRIAAYELCDVPASLPLFVLPTDPNWMMKQENAVKNEPEYGWNSTHVTFNPALYDEIIKVSIGCNTEVTIPPIEEREESDETKPASKFLKNIVNNLNKDDAGSLLNSSTTLFSSIQALVQKKCVATGTENEQICDITEESNEHGEDKTIMHLRKDRLRPFKCSVELQTDNIALFPPLLLSPSLIFNRIRNARNYRRKISGSRSRSRSFSPNDAEYDRVRYHNSKRYPRSQHSTYSSSMNSSSSESSSESDSNESRGGSSSRSASSDSLKRFNNRENFRFYNRNQRDHGYNYQGEQNFLVKLEKH